MMQNFDVEIHSVESQQVLQVVNSPFLTGSATIARVPSGSKFCLERLGQKLLMVPFDPIQEVPTKRKDEEIQIARRLAMVSSRIYIASSTSVSSIIATPWFLQADALLDSNCVEEALALTDQAAQAMDDMQLDAERLVNSHAIDLTSSFTKWPTSIRKQDSSFFEKHSSKTPSNTLKKETQTPG